MPNDLTAPVTLEPFAENQIATLIRAQVTTIGDEDIVTAHGTRQDTAERPAIEIRVDRDEETVQDSGWWDCSVEVKVDPTGRPADWLDAVTLGVEHALGNNDGNIAADLTAGRLNCMAGSVENLQPTEIDDSDGARYFRTEATFGLTAPA